MTISIKSKQVFVGLFLLYVAFGAYLLKEYFLITSNVIIGLLIAPYLLQLDKGNKSSRFLAPALLFSCLLPFIPAQTTVFLALLFSSLWLLEGCIGRANNTFLFLLLIISPIFFYLNNTAGIPMRLEISAWVGKIFSILGFKVEVSGIVITLNNLSYSVDSACSGLSMTTISMILTLFILSFHSKKAHKKLSLLITSLVLILTYVLNIISNVIRIIVLVAFDIRPEYFSHDIVGIICLALYVIIPVSLFIKRLMPLLPERAKGESTEKLDWKPMLLATVILVFTALFSLNMDPSKAMDANNNSQPQISGYRMEVLNGGVLKYTNPNALLYVKPMHYYGADHSPSVCWSGEGYTFGRVNKEKVGDYNVYTGVIKKDKEELFTSWWFDNGKTKTINQLEWRWAEITGEKPFFLVNVSAISKEELLNKTKQLLLNINLHQND